MFPEIETPALLVEQPILQRNLEAMQRLANHRHLSLRPHIKTHKSVRIAKMQMAGGACGIAVAKLSEAEIMADNGIGDIQIANEIVGQDRIRRLLDLTQRVTVSCCVDSPRNVRELAEAFSANDRILNVLVEIDTGLHRCGLSDPDEIVRLCRLIERSDGLKLAGIMTHAGHAYAAGTVAEIADIGRQEGETMIKIAASLRGIGLRVELISVGSTPTAQFASEVAGVTELRVGNYVFNDMIQVSLGVAGEEQCALTVLSTVISTPTASRAVLDAGSKSLTTEQGAHGNRKATGFGRILGGKAELTRLSEEHGVIDNAGFGISIGSRVRVIPNHACATVNLYDSAYLVDGQRVLEQIPIDARGCVT